MAVRPFFNCASVAVFCSLSMLSGQSLAAQNDQKLITLDAPGWSLRRICSAISSQIGQQVEPHGSCVDDYLIIHVHNVPWPTLMKKLAWVEYGKWYMDGNTLTLETDKELVAARIQQNEDALAQRLADQFKKDAATSSAPFNSNELVKELKLKADLYARKDTSNEPANVKESLGIEYASIRLRSKMPLHAGFKKIIESFPPKDLAEIPNGGRFVFSNHPTSLQYAMPATAMTVIKQAVANQLKLIKAARSAGITLRDMQCNGSPANISLDDTFEVSARQSFGIGIQASFRIFGPKGDLVLQDSRQFGFLGAGMNLNLTPKNELYKKLDPVAAQNFKSLNLFSSIPPSPEFRYILRHPEKFDPLAVVLEPILKVIAPQENILIRNDYLLFLASGTDVFKNGDEVPMNLLTSAIAKMVSDEDTNQNWLALRTNYVITSALQSIPRAQYQDLIQGISTNGLVDFLSAVKYAGAVGPSGYFSGQLTSPFVSALAYGQNPLEQDQQNWMIFSLVGSLDAGQLAQAQSSRGLNMAELPSEPAKIFKKILLDKFITGLIYAQGGRIPMQKPTIIEDEPTYAFANSMPKAILSIQVKRNDVILYSYKFENAGLPSSPQQNLASDPTTFAETIYSQKFNHQMHYDFSHLRVSPQETVTISILFPETKMAALTAQFVTRAHTTQVYSGWQELPAPLKTKIESQLKKMNYKPGN